MYSNRKSRSIFSSNAYDDDEDLVEETKEADLRDNESGEFGSLSTDDSFRPNYSQHADSDFDSIDRVRMVAEEQFFDSAYQEPIYEIEGDENDEGNEVDQRDMVEETKETKNNDQGESMPLVFPIDLGDEVSKSWTLTRRLGEASCQFTDILRNHKEGSGAKTAPEFDPYKLRKLFEQWEEHWSVQNPDEVADRIIQREYMDPQGTKLQSNYKHLQRLHEVLELMLDYADMASEYKDRLVSIKLNMQHAFDFSYNRAILSGDMHMQQAQEIANNQIDLDKLKPAQKLLVYLQSLCRSKGYRKFGDKLYVQVVKDGHFTKAFKPLIDPNTDEVYTIERWCYEMTTGERSPEMWKARTDAAQNMDFVVRDLTKNRERDAPILRKERNIWSFANGRYNGTTDEFVPYGSPEPEEWTHLYSAKYIDSELTDTDPVGPDCSFDDKTGIYSDRSGQFVRRYNKETGEFFNEAGDVVFNERTGEGVKPPKSCMDISVPPYDHITGFQRWTHIVKYTHLAFLGRLAFPLGAQNGGDNFEAVGMTYGEAGTGKSSYLEAAMEIYDCEDIFTVESSGEDTFQLMGAKDKLMWVWPEVKRSAKLAPDRFQQMVSGEDMIAPVKGKARDAFKWLLPGYMVGNDPLCLPGSKGSVARRVVLFQHLYPISKTTVDTSLKTTLKTVFLANFIRKIVCCRKFFVAEVGKRGIWDKGVLAEEFHRSREKVHANTNVVYDFIRNNCRTPKTAAPEGKGSGPSCSSTVAEVGDATVWFTPFNVFLRKLNESIPKNAPKPAHDDIVSTLEIWHATVECFGANKGTNAIDKNEYRMDLAQDVEIYNEFIREQSRLENYKSIHRIRYRDEWYTSEEQIIKGLRMNGDGQHSVIIEFIDGTELCEGDYVGNFLSLFYETKEDGVIQCSEMFHDYRSWCEALELVVLKEKQFIRALKVRYNCKKASTGVRRLSCHGLVKKSKAKYQEGANVTMQDSDGEGEDDEST
jgi:hypothetical protein